MPRARTRSNRIRQLIREGYPDGHGQAGAIAYREWREGKVRSNPDLTHFKQIAPNMTEVRHGEIKVLYSYNTPVAIKAPSGLYRTTTHHSQTTARHISKWGAKYAERISQDRIEISVLRGIDPADTSLDTAVTQHGLRRNPEEQRGDVHVDIHSHNPDDDDDDSKETKVLVEVWEERDRLHIALYRDTVVNGIVEDTELVAEWWDDDAREMFEDGFFKRGRKLESSVIAYAEKAGLL